MTRPTQKEHLRVSETFTRSQVRMHLLCAISKLGGMLCADSNQPLLFQLRSWNTVMMEFRRRQIFVYGIYGVSEIDRGHSSHLVACESSALSANKIQAPNQHLDYTQRDDNLDRSQGNNL
eukprot:Gregarina_sp_Poly_1__1450@NODE_1362_length_4291_cov_30_314867_g912_i0_p2_GENE_NODE_1362_length_4291_cov_30_314867_g912_i0NODE_1362_length_4291_cov_30_314867_g912_i0_p2_ORF_typecomplete_len120_score5_61_NODE_1362_length_4291_cov_30_314867_g912_i014311790